MHQIRQKNNFYEIKQKVLFSYEQTSDDSEKPYPRVDSKTFKNTSIYSIYFKQKLRILSSSACTMNKHPCTILPSESSKTFYQFF